MLLLSPPLRLLPSFFELIAVGPTLFPASGSPRRDRIFFSLIENGPKILIDDLARAHPLGGGILFLPPFPEDFFMDLICRGCTYTRVIEQKSEGFR